MVFDNNSGGPRADDIRHKSVGSLEDWYLSMDSRFQYINYKIIKRTLSQYDIEHTVEISKHSWNKTRPYEPNIKNDCFLK